MSVRYVPISCLLILVTFAPSAAHAAQAADAPPHVETFENTLAALGPEGRTIQMVDVPRGWGDGRVTERDLLALARYCVWGFNTLFTANEQEQRLDAGAESRMVDFWLYVWDDVAPEAKAAISASDVLWPTIARAWQAGGQLERESMVYQFADLVQAVWGGIEQETVSYLAARTGPAAYVGLVDRWVADRRGRGGAAALGGALSVMADYARSDGDALVHDGTGDIIYPDDCCG
jgi:hypothetical protein